MKYRNIYNKTKIKFIFVFIIKNISNYIKNALNRTKLKFIIITRIILIKLNRIIINSYKRNYKFIIK